MRAFKVPAKDPRMPAQADKTHIDSSAIGPRPGMQSEFGSHSLNFDDDQAIEIEDEVFRGGDAVSSMPESEDHEITRLLLRWCDPVARERLFAFMYPALRQMAVRRMLHERKGHTMQATELIAELYLTLATRHAVNWQNRNHFKAVAANTMRRIVIDYAKRASARKRTLPVSSDRAMVDPERAARSDYFDQLVWIDQLLEVLAGHNARVADVFTCRYFGGMSFEEIGEAWSLHPKTMKRDYKYAKEWLQLKLENKRVDGGKAAL
jgi:RNA polymerase sigma factor (TIGR02999 family)